MAFAYRRLDVGEARPGRASLDLNPLDFRLPASLEAGEPPEVRGQGRDDVRLLVSYMGEERIDHAHFRDLPCFLSPGDVLVINTSGTRRASLPAQRADGAKLRIHLSTQLPAGLWLVELRQPDGQATQSFFEGRAGESLDLPGGGTVTIHTTYGETQRLWVASLRLPAPLDDFLTAYGAPIRYAYASGAWPIEAYQTVYATEMGSAEMPSAGRAFTPELLTRMVAQGVHIAPLLLHTGVASQEEGELPYEEYYRVPAPSARLVNGARAAGGRVIAVGTTVVRALETVSDDRGGVHPGEGYTGLVITPKRGLRAVDGLLTGLHEPQATHLAMLEALAGRHHLALSYGAALRERYLWHEFGDLHLILP